MKIVLREILSGTLETRNEEGRNELWVNLELWKRS
jgi:hypothetical protein